MKQIRLKIQLVENQLQMKEADNRELQQLYDMAKAQSANLKEDHHKTLELVSELKKQISKHEQSMMEQSDKIVALELSLQDAQKDHQNRIESVTTSIARERLISKLREQLQSVQAESKMAHDNLLRENRTLQTTKDELQRELETEKLENRRLIKTKDETIDELRRELQKAKLDGAKAVESAAAQVGQRTEQAGQQSKETVAADKQSPCVPPTRSSILDITRGSQTQTRLSSVRPPYSRSTERL